MKPSPHTHTHTPMTDSVPSSCSSFTHKIASLLSAFPNLALRNRGSSAPAADTRYTLGKKLLFHKRPSFFASESFLKARLGNPFSLVSSLSSLFTYLFHFFPSLLKKTAYFVRSSRNPDLLGSDEIGKSGREAEGNFPQEKIQPRLPKEKLSYRSSFTLIELLIVIAILVILAVVVILTLNPSELLAQSRDSARLSDMASLNSAINIYLVDSAGTGFLGTSSVVYVSLPDTASSTCGDLGLPLLPSGYSYNCVSTTSLVKTDGTGWLPVKLASTSSGTPLGSLPKDPTNASSSNLYYTYVTDGNGNYELTMLPESQKYASAAATDGGIDPAMYETGNKLTLSPFAHGMVGYWPMNEGNGTVVYDQSGYGNNGNINDFNGDANLSNTIQWQQGNCISNYCLHFIGTGVASTTGRVIMIGNNTKNSTSSITLMGWIDDLATPPGWELYFSLGLDDHLDFNNFRSMLSTADRSSYSIYPSPTLNISLSTWHFLALTYDGSIAKEYFDGQQVGSLVINKLLYQESATLTQINGWQLYDNGQYYTASSTLQNNIREYNHALSATEIQAIYNAKQ